MEKNTFPISTYIAADQDSVFSYLEDLRGLSEWALVTKMKEKIDEDTWLGSAFVQKLLYYHLRRGVRHPFRNIEWHCGTKYREYDLVFFGYLVPPDYIKSGSSETGVYFHWVGFLDPAKGNTMLSLGLNSIHNSEARSLKAVLESRAGLHQPATGRYAIKTASIYIDAPLEAGLSYLTDLCNVEFWTHRLRPQSVPDGHFVDEYQQPVHLKINSYDQGNYCIIEYNLTYPKEGISFRNPIILFPCSYAFANPSASGFILHRLTFQKEGHSGWRYGERRISDYHAENINAKRLIEVMANNFSAFVRGPSYELPGMHE